MLLWRVCGDAKFLGHSTNGWIVVDRHRQLVAVLLLQEAVLVLLEREAGGEGAALKVVEVNLFYACHFVLLQPGACLLESVDLARRDHDDLGFA